MALKVLFWLFAAVDAAALGLWLVLALAAAGPSRTNPLAVVVMALLPALALAGAVVLHQRGSPGLRAVAFALVGAPLGIVAIQMVVALANLPAAGGLFYGETPLAHALRELPHDPAQLATVRELLANGAQPDEPGPERPLALAVYATRTAGTAALQLLLDAGADPNACDEFGTPAWFAATASAIDLAVLDLLLARGVDLQATARDGRGAAWAATMTSNWPAAQRLVERGAPIGGRSPMGLTLLDTLEGEARGREESAALTALIAAVRRR